MNAVRYENVFAQSTFQYDGHLADYLIAHTDDLALLCLQTRFGTGCHELRRYHRGKLMATQSFSARHGIVSYYLQMLGLWRRELKRFSRGGGPVTAIFTHPLLAFGCQGLRKIRTVFWQWDYFPDGVPVSRLFNAVAAYYAKRVDRYLPLTAAIGRVMGMPEAAPMPLGMTVPERFGDPASHRLLMVGQLRPGQGVESVLDFLAANREYSLALCGRAVPGFAETLKRRIRELKLETQVSFPDTVVPEAELRELTKQCLVSLALYDTGRDNLTNYADPGKVKSSIEMGLPVVMTRISAVVPMIERFHAGEIIDGPAELPAAIARIRSDPQPYFDGCRQFAEHFSTDRVYSVMLTAEES